jgi:hypothetical protein
MEPNLALKIYSIVKGYIDAKDDKGNTLCGTILSVVSRRDINYLSVMFSRDEVSKSMEWGELFSLHVNREKERGRDPVIIHHEEELFKYLSRGTVLNTVVKNRNTKQAEQAISRYCLEELHLKSVSFIEYFDASESDITLFAKEGGPASGVSTGGRDFVSPEKPKEAVAVVESVPDSVEEPKAKDEIIVRCEPVLDPVNGVAMNELSVGERVHVKLPENSVFFKLLSKNIPTFDGVINGAITGVLQNELGTATISLNLSDGISGVMKLSGKVRIKVAQNTDNEGASRNKARDLSSALVFGAAGIIIVFSAIALLYYILNW